jgi:predicted small lipoprotein YifL
VKWEDVVACCDAWRLSSLYARRVALGFRRYTCMMSRVPIVFSRCILVGAALFVLTACGNKGALVMPQKPVNVPEQPLSLPKAKSQGDKGASPPPTAKPVRSR